MPLGNSPPRRISVRQGDFFLVHRWAVFQTETGNTCSDMDCLRNSVTVDAWSSLARCENTYVASGAVWRLATDGCRR